MEFLKEFNLYFKSILMEIFEANGQFHVAISDKVAGSFQTEKEAIAFRDSCLKGEMVPLTTEQKDKLLTVEQVKAGEQLTPTFEGNHVTSSPSTLSGSPTIEAVIENVESPVEEESTL